MSLQIHNHCGSCLQFLSLKESQISDASSGCPHIFHKHCWSGEGKSTCKHCSKALNVLKDDPVKGIRPEQS
jgi:hypothetical protein